MNGFPSWPASNSTGVTPLPTWTVPMLPSTVRTLYLILFCWIILPTLVSLITSELGVSARIGSLGTYAAKITAAVVNDNIVVFFI